MENTMVTNMKALREDVIDDILSLEEQIEIHCEDNDFSVQNTVNIWREQIKAQRRLLTALDDVLWERFDIDGSRE